MGWVVGQSGLPRQEAATDCPDLPDQRVAYESALDRLSFAVGD